MLVTLLLSCVGLPAPPDFVKDVQPVLQAKCVRCHGGERTRAELDLRNRAGMVKGGEGGPALAPGSAEKSLLWIHISADRMPPGKEKLTTAQKTTLRAWIEAGAHAPEGPALAPAPGLTEADRNFWSFRPPVRPALPGMQSSLARGPIDRFLLAALAKKGLSFSPAADRSTLLRRVTFDLTGLPPTPDEIESFLGDNRPGAWERVVDRLLASPRYGERWGRHWLDLAGYADSEGILDADYVRTAAWRYRDWVIRALNADRPYDRFLEEQLAGDELSGYWEAYSREEKLPAEVVEAITATGFLRCAADTSRPDFVSIKNAPGYYYQTLDDTLKIVATATLGLSVQCAKCHSHKFDPIPHTDYYRMQAIFMGAYRPSQWVPQVQRRLLDATARQENQAKRINQCIDVQVKGLQRLQGDLDAHFAARLFEERLLTLPEVLRADVRQALAIPAPKQTEVQKYLAGKFAGFLRPAGPALSKELARVYPEYSSRLASLSRALQAEQARRPAPFTEIRALYDLPGSVPTPLLRRGEYLNPGMEVQPGVLSVLGVPVPFQWQAPGKEVRSSGRRLAFARWLTQKNHPLTARVLVNRVWMHHFGEGIVSTPENFGRQGNPPSHPELLDWLACEFQDTGYSLKHLHRLMLTSAAYQQSSQVSNELARKLDPDNRLLWRQRLRRLEAESLRDAILATTGDLTGEIYGPPVPMVQRGDGEVVTPEGPAGKRRSVYLQVRRSQPLTILQVFDQPVMETNCTRRSTSTVSSQALTLLNSDLMMTQARVFADRLGREPGDPIRRAFVLALGRPPRPHEQDLLTDFLARQTARHGAGEPARRAALTDLCQMLLCANEFVYID